jgi:hypothetical protein
MRMRTNKKSLKSSKQKQHTPKKKATILYFHTAGEVSKKNNPQKEVIGNKPEALNLG